MDNGLIFPYQRLTAQPEPGLLRMVLRGYPNRLVVGQRRGDAGR